MKIPLRYIFVVVFLAAAFFIRVKLQNPPETLPKNGKITFAATLKTEPKISDKYQILAIADAKIYAPFFPEYQVGDRLKISGKIDSGGRMFYPTIEKTGEEKSMFGFLRGIRTKISQNLARLMPGREATLLQGTVVGVDSIDQGFRDQLIKTGTIHVVVVSGQNMAIVAGIFTAFAKYIGRRKSLVLASTVVILYGALAGFSAPVMRAVVMVLASTIAVYFGREVWPVWNLLLAALVILFISPQAVGEASFQLTFAASLGIMTLGRYLENKIVQGPVAGSSHPTSSVSISSNRDQTRSSGLRVLDGTPSARATPRNFVLATRNFLFWFGNASAVAISAYIFTLPVIFFTFGRISFWAPVVNVLVAEAVAPIMFLGFAVAGASLIFMPLAQLLAFLAYAPAVYFVKVVEVFAGI